jgi:DNA-binding FrmR family transcriptional regulator
MASDTTQPDLIRRLRSAEGHLRGITGMVEAGASCQHILHQVLAVRGALHGINQILIQHHLHDCLRAELENRDPAVRERAIENVIAFYELVGAGALLANGKEIV